MLTKAADVKTAYGLIGYTPEYARVICVDADEAPDDEILKMHRQASQQASTQQEKQELSTALATIGKHRKNAMMVRFGESGKSLMTVDEAYAALSAPKDSIDDGLIMLVPILVCSSDRIRANVLKAIRDGCRCANGKIRRLTDLTQVNDYPGRAEHYRSCLEIIAKQDDVDRSGLKRYLETGSQGGSHRE